MVEHDGRAARAVHGAREHVADLQRTLGNTTQVAVELAGELAGIGHLDPHLRRLQHAGVADLAAGLGVERGAVGDHDHFLARAGRIDRTAVAQQGHHLQALSG